jgi:hypothetical protein
MCVCVCVYVYVCMYALVCVCVFVCARECARAHVNFTELGRNTSGVQKPFDVAMVFKIKNDISAPSSRKRFDPCHHQPISRVKRRKSPC